MSKRTIQLSFITTLLALLLVLAGCGDGGKTTPEGEAHSGKQDAGETTDVYKQKKELNVPAGEVWLQDFRYHPALLTVSVGDTVTFINKDNTKHTVSSGTPDHFDHRFHKEIQAGERYEHVFTKPGTFTFFCTYHPKVMRGKIVVKGEKGETDEGGEMQKMAS